MIVYGHRLYGYCDAVPGQFHVATQFVHIWFVPLVPLGSYVVLEGESEGNSWRGVKIGFSLKSLLFAWGRAGLILSTLGGLVGGVMLLADAEILGGLASLIAAVVCGVAVFASYRLLGNASPARTQELFAKLGVSSPIGAGPQAADPQLPAPPANPWPQPQQPWSPQQGGQQPWPPQQAAQQPWPPQQAAQQPWPPQQASQQAAQQAWPPQQASQQPWQQQQASPQPWPPQQAQQPWPPQQAAQQPWPPQQAAQQPWPPQGAQQPWPPQQAGQPQASVPQPYPPGDWPRR
jgi:hypothetical protein